MTNLKSVEQPEPKPSAFGKLAPDAGEKTTAKGVRKESEAREPQMRALRRIFGDVVLGIFPPELIDAVEKCYVFWEENPDSYINTQFDTAEELQDSLLAMRAYAECAGADGYTVRTLSKEDPTLLTWRVQPRRKVGPKD